MNTAILRNKRVILPTIAAIGLLTAGGTLWSATASDHLSGGERDRAARVAVDAVGGTALEVETSDDPGEAYEVEVRTDDGAEVEVVLDRDLKVVSRDLEHSDEAGDEADEAGDD